MLTTVTKELTFDCAHLLSGYDGACKNLHGHTYKLQVTIVGPAKNGMIIDFKDLKEALGQIVMRCYDHAFICGDSAFEYELAELLEKSGRKVYYLERRTTAENMANSIYEALDCLISPSDHDVLSVKLWETPTSFAEVK